MIFTVPFAYEAYATKRRRQKPSQMILIETFEFEVPELSTSAIGQTIDIDDETYPVVDGVIQVPVLAAQEYGYSVIPAKGPLVRGDELQQFLTSMGKQKFPTPGSFKSSVREPFTDHSIMPGHDDDPGKYHSAFASECDDIQASNREEHLEAALHRASTVVLIDGIVHSSAYEPALKLGYADSPAVSWTMESRFSEKPNDMCSFCVSGRHAKRLGVETPAGIEWQMDDRDLLRRAATNQFRSLVAHVFFPGNVFVAGAGRKFVDEIGHAISDIQRSDDLLEMLNIIRTTTDCFRRAMWREPDKTAYYYQAATKLVAAAEMAVLDLQFDREDEAAIELLSVNP